MFVWLQRRVTHCKVPGTLKWHPTHLQRDMWLVGTYRAVCWELTAVRFVFVPVLCLDSVSWAEVLHSHETHHISFQDFHVSPSAVDLRSKTNSRACAKSDNSLANTFCMNRGLSDWVSCFRTAFKQRRCYEPRSDWLKAVRRHVTRAFALSFRTTSVGG